MMDFSEQGELSLKGLLEGSQVGGVGRDRGTKQRKTASMCKAWKQEKTRAPEKPT